MARKTVEAARGALTAMLGPNVAVAMWGVDTLEAGLLPEELDAVRSAVPSRREEFARGRACARSAMVALGHPPVAITVGAAREPIWPSGLVGSITHSGGLVLAVAARTALFQGIGVDVEVFGGLTPDLVPQVLTPTEIASGGGPAGPTGVFSAKESVHKVVYPLTRRWLDFQHVEVRFGDPPGSFAVRPSDHLVDPPRALTRVVGAVATIPGYVVSTAVLAL